MSTHTNKTIQQICDEDTGDSSLITNLVRRGKELEKQLEATKLGALYFGQQTDKLERHRAALISAGDSIIAEYYDPSTQRRRGCLDQWDKAKNQ